MKQKKHGQFAGHTGALKVFPHGLTRWFGVATRKQEARLTKKIEAEHGPRGAVGSKESTWSPTLARKMEFLKVIGVL